MRPPTLNLLRQLLVEHSVAESRLSAGCRRELQPFFDSGALEQRRAGAGSRVVVVDAAAIAGMLAHYTPDSAEAVAPLSGRAQAVRMFRNSHRVNADTPLTLLLRAPGAGAILTKPQLELDISAQTRAYGVAALATVASDQWYCPAALALVENEEAFYFAERLPQVAANTVFIYYSGHISDKLAQWLSAQPRTPQLLVYPDYDPVGLHNYERMRRLLADITPVQLVLPADFEALLARYGRPELLREQRQYLPTLQQSPEPLVHSVIELLQRHGCGLEQEALLSD